jgi:hypothetical protein
MNLRLFVILLILLIPTHLLGQKSVPKDTSAVTAEELEAIISEADKLDNKNAMVNIKSRAAMMVSFTDPARSESMFLAIWKFTNGPTDEAFDKEQAKLLILKYLFSRNPKLARQFLTEQPKPPDSSTEPQALSNDSELRSVSKLASLLADSDPSAAAGLLEQSLSIAPTPVGLAALNRLREKNSFLSDYVATKVIERLPTQPTLVSLPSLHMLGAYVFPGAEAPMSSMEAESSLQLLQYKYFLASYEALRASLRETNEALLKDQHYTQPELQFRAAYQAQVAAILAALAPRFQPSLAVELTGMANKLAPQVPPEFAQLARFTLAKISGSQATTDDPETNFFLAISNGDFDEASKQLDRLKSGEKKDTYAQLLLKSQARALLAKSDVMGALTIIRKLQDETTRIVMYLDAMKATKKKQDPNLSSIVINEARLLVPQTNRNGVHVRALLSFASQLANPGTKDDAVEFLNSAVVSINALGRGNNEEAKTPAEEAMALLNDPNSLFDSTEMEQAFTSVGLVDFERGLALAHKIEIRPIQLLARLQTIHGTIKRGSPKPKVPAKPANVLSNSRQ